jgi:hypothetical protein
VRELKLQVKAPVNHLLVGYVAINIKYAFSFYVAGRQLNR